MNFIIRPLLQMSRKSTGFLLITLMMLLLFSDACYFILKLSMSEEEERLLFLPYEEDFKQ